MIFFYIVNVLLGALALLTAREFHSFYSSPQIPLLEYVPEVEVNVDPSSEADLPLSHDQHLDMNWTRTNVEDLPLSNNHVVYTNWNDTIIVEPLAKVYDHCLDDYTENYAFPVFSIAYLAGVLLLFGVLFYKQRKNFWQQKSAMDAELQALRNKMKENEEMTTEHSLLQDEVFHLRMEIASSRQNALYLEEKMKQNNKMIEDERNIFQEEKQQLQSTVHTYKDLVKSLEQEMTIAQEERRCHELHLREKEEELGEIQTKLQETQRLLDTKIQESETKVEQMGLVTQQKPELEEDKPRKASPIEGFHNTDQDNYVTFKGEEIYCEPTGPTTMLTAKFEVNKGSHPLIVGKRGFVISNIENFSRTKIQIPAQYEMSSIVSVTGDKENIQCALDMIEAILINNNAYESDTRNLDDNISFKGNVLYGHPTGQPEFLKVSIELPNNQRRAVVGYKGRNIDCVENISKVEIQLPRVHENSNVVSVTGRKSNIQLAFKMMEYLLRNFGYYD